MLKKEFFIGLLIALFSLGLTGVTFADDPGQNLSEEVNTYVEKDIMAETEIFTQPSSIDLEHGNLDVRIWVNDSEPLLCAADLAPATEQFASNECADFSEDLYRS